MDYKLFIYLLLYFSFIFGQEQDSNTQSIVNTNSQAKFLPEIAELKLQFIQNGLEIDNLFRLASFYLSANQFEKAAIFYNLYIEKIEKKPKLIKIKKLDLANAHYNRALALFSLRLYHSAQKEFLLAYQRNSQLVDSLRMIGTIYYITQNKTQTLFYWNKYLISNNTPSPERTAIEIGIKMLSDPNFSFKKEDATNSLEKRNPTWPFLDPDTIPYPNSRYEKKRVI